MGLVRGEQGGGRQSQSGRGGVTDIEKTCGPWQFIHGNTAKRNLFGNDSVFVQHGTVQLQTLRTRRVSSKELLSRAVPIADVWNCSNYAAGNCRFAQREQCPVATARRVRASALPARCREPCAGTPK